MLCFWASKSDFESKFIQKLHFHIKSWISHFWQWKSQISHNFLFTHEMMNFLCTIDLIEENLIKLWHFMHLFSVNWARILHNSLPIWLDYSLIFCFYFCREFQKSGPMEENWWIKCTMDPPSFGMDSKVGAAMVGSALICKKKKSDLISWR